MTPTRSHHPEAALVAAAGRGGRGGASLRTATLLFVLAIAVPCLGQEQTYELTADDQWSLLAEKDPDGEAAQLLQVRRALGIDEPQRALNLVEGFLERAPFSKWRPEALLLKGDAQLALGNEYDALMTYESLVQRYPGSAVFVTALEREYDIAKAYAGGLKRKFLGLFRILDTADDAEELLIRIQERLPGSTLAENAGMTLADFYFDRRDLFMAAEAYDIFIENYPRSTQIDKARLRLIYAYLANFRGPQYDAVGLLEAQARLRELQAIRPALAQKVGAEALLVRVYESDAIKMLETARWYLETEDPVSAEYVIRRLVEAYPDSIATIEALRMIPSILARMPEAAVAAAPDYAAWREAKLGLSPSRAAVPRGIVPRADPLPGVADAPGGDPSNPSGEASEPSGSPPATSATTPNAP